MRFKTQKITLATCILIALGACSPNTSNEEYISNAKVQIQKNNNAEAVINLKNVLKSDSKNAEGRFLLGSIYLKEGDSTSALKELSLAHELGSNNQDLYPLLARAYLLEEQPFDVLQLSKEINISGEALVHYLAYDILANLRLGNEQEASDLLSQSDQLGSGTLYNLLAHAYFEISLDNEKKSVDFINQGLKIDPNQPDLNLLAGQAAFIRKDYPTAVIAFENHIKAQPKYMMAYAMLANAALQDKQFEKAEKYADILLKINPNLGMINQVKAYTRYQADDLEAANSAAIKAIQFGSGSVGVKILAGVSAFKLEHYQQAYNYLNSIKNDVPDGHPARKFLAFSELRLGNTADAVETFNTMADFTTEDVGFLSSASNMLMQAGQYDTAKLLLNKAEAASPDDPKLLLSSGLLKSAMNDKYAFLEFEKALALEPTFVDAKKALIMEYLSIEEFDKAEKIAQEWLDESPELVDGYNLLALIHIRKAEFNQAKPLLEKAIKVNPENIDAYLYLAHIALAEQNKDLAVAELDKALVFNPSNLNILNKRYRLKSDEIIKEKIIAYYNDHKNDLPASMLMSKVYYDQQEYSKVILLLQNFKGAEGAPAAYWKLLVSAHYKLNNMTDVDNTLNKWIGLSSYNALAVMSTISLYESQKKHDQAIDLLRKSIDARPENHAFKVAQVQLFLLTNDVSSAKTLLSTISRSLIPEELIGGLEGQILLKENQVKLALPKLRSYYEMTPNNFTIRLLVAAYRKNNQDDKAITYLESYLANNSTDSKSRFLLSDIYLNKNIDKAIEQYQMLIASGETNAVILNNISWALGEKGDYPQALTYINKALDALPNNAQVLDTKAMILSKSGNIAEALNVIEKAYKSSNGGNNPVAFNYVKLLINNNDKEKAKDILSLIEPNSDQERIEKKNLIEQL
jgi:putative PEP-CTERM system TPR-repeat lipoprotein